MMMLNALVAGRAWVGGRSSPVEGVGGWEWGGRGVRGTLSLKACLPLTFSEVTYSLPGLSSHKHSTCTRLFSGYGGLIEADILGVMDWQTCFYLTSPTDWTRADSFALAVLASFWRSVPPPSTWSTRNRQRQAASSARRQLAPTTNGQLRGAEREGGWHVYLRCDVFGWGRHWMPSTQLCDQVRSDRTRSGSFTVYLSYICSQRPLGCDRRT